MNRAPSEDLHNSLLASQDLAFFEEIHKKVSGKLIHEHLWVQRTEPLSVRRGAGVARRADRGEAHEQFTQVQAARMRKTLLLLCGLY